MYDVQRITVLGVLAAVVVPEPDTACPVCWNAEQPAWLRSLRAVLGHRPKRPALQILLRSALGGAERSWYERHREKWETTGSVLELERMIRHIWLE